MPTRNRRASWSIDFSFPLGTGRTYSAVLRMSNSLAPFSWKITLRYKLLPPVSEIHSIFHIPPNWEETQCITSTLALHHRLNHVIPLSTLWVSKPLEITREQLREKAKAVHVTWRAFFRLS